VRAAWLSALGAALMATVVACVPVAPNEHIGQTPQPPTALSTGPITFDFASIDDRAVNAPAFRGKPAVLAFLVTDTLAGQAEADILSGLAQQKPDAAHFAIVAVEPEERHELVQGFVRFFTDKTHAPLYGAMADKDLLLGQGPFGDVRTLTVVVLDARGRIVLRKAGVVQAADIVRALATPTM
jgi:hypothetical protein